VTCLPCTIGVLYLHICLCCARLSRSNKTYFLHVCVCNYQARREPQRGPGKHSRGAPKHFHGAPLGRKFLNFFFKMVHFGVLYVSGRRLGPQNVAGPGVANPPPPPSLRTWQFTVVIETICAAATGAASPAAVHRQLYPAWRGSAALVVEHVERLWIESSDSTQASPPQHTNSDTSILTSISAN